MVKLTVNGRERIFAGSLELPLLWWLRDEIGLTGTKFGCGALLPDPDGGGCRPYGDHD